MSVYGIKHAVARQRHGDVAPMSALAAMRRLERLAAHPLRGGALPAADAAAIGAAIAQVTTINSLQSNCKAIW
jgi:hypothetical protein